MTTRRATPADDAPDRARERADPEAPSDTAGQGDHGTGGRPDRVDLSGLSIVGITRRRVGFVASAFVAVWIVIVFARQVGDASAASNRAAQLAIDNAALAAEVQSLEREVQVIVQPQVVGLAARGYGLGDPREIPFTLDPSVSAPVDGAPGSASVRLGANADRQTPLESWLSLLFGPAD
ncbi:MAG: hypothetical protein ACJ761_09285 [Chloroflexota bacterium]